VSVAHTYNTNYSEGRGQEDYYSKPAWANSSTDPISKISNTKKGWQSGSSGRMLAYQVWGPERETKTETERDLHTNEKTLELKNKFSKVTGCKNQYTKFKWIKKMWYLYTMEFYSSTKNEILSFAGKWLELENITLNEVSQDQKAKSLMFSLICGL
jgi:hypothetical protein